MHNCRTAIIVGASRAGNELYNQFNAQTLKGYNLLGFFDDEPSKVSQKHLYLGNTSICMDYVLKNHVDEIFCALPYTEQETIERLMSDSDKNLIGFKIIGESVKLNDYTIFNSDVDIINTESKCLINTLNQYSYTIAEEDPEFKKALVESDILLPDGIAIVAAAKLLKNKSIKKIAGADIHHHLLEKLNTEGGRAFYMGACEKTLEAIKNRLALEYPNIQVGSYSPPFKDHFTDQDNTNIIESVNAFKPDVLFIGMTAPKQEKWAYEHKMELDVNVICSIGAVFDFYAGTVNRPSQFWINLGLEWFVRLVKEPKRMSKRYLYYGPVFIQSIMKYKALDIYNKNVEMLKGIWMKSIID